MPNPRPASCGSGSVGRQGPAGAEHPRCCMAIVVLVVLVAAGDQCSSSFPSPSILVIYESSFASYASFASSTSSSVMTPPSATAHTWYPSSCTRSRNRRCGPRVRRQRRRPPEPRPRMAPDLLPLSLGLRQLAGCQRADWGAPQPGSGTSRRHWCCSAHWRCTDATSAHSGRKWPTQANSMVPLLHGSPMVLGALSSAEA